MNHVWKKDANNKEKQQKLKKKNLLIGCFFLYTSLTFEIKCEHLLKYHVIQFLKNGIAINPFQAGEYYI